MIFFIRHGESEANLKGVFAGQRDNSLLTEKGRDQAKITGQAIKNKGIIFDRIIASPLIRSMKTANIIADEIGFDNTKIKSDSRIMEYDMGNLTGTPIVNISSVVLASGENAEDTEKFKERVIECIKDFSKESGNTLLVSHAGVGRILETIKEKMNSNLFYDLPAWPNASIVEIDWVK